MRKEIWRRSLKGNAHGYYSTDFIVDSEQVFIDSVVVAEYAFT